MGDRVSGRDRTLDFADAEKVDRACDRFEADLQTGVRPRVEDYLADAPADRRGRLLEELVALEVDYRRRAGEALGADEYCRRFPELDPVRLAALLAAAPAAPETLASPPANDGGEVRAVQVRCPHCHNPLHLADGRSDEVLCPGCGSTFRIREARQTTTTGPARQIGKFQLLERVGLGAFGAVWRAHDTELDRVVALKIPHASLLTSEADLERFHREARAAAQLRHPGIVTVHEVQTLEGLPTIVSDFVEGVPLKDLLEVRRLTFREAAALVAEVAEALDYAHGMGLVHRDVKPANILMEYGRPPAGQPTAPAPARLGRPLVTDFGLALREAVEVTMTLDGHVIGTPAYMPPEQAAGRGHQADRRSDVYGLGVVLYELLAGELPFRGSKLMILHQVMHEEPRPPRRVNDKIPRDLETVCLKAMASAPARRYATARELADDLRRFLDGEPIRARPVASWERLLRWAKRRPAVAALLASLLLVLSFGLGLVTLLWQRAERSATAETNAKTEAQAAGVAAIAQAEAATRAKTDAQLLSANLAVDRGLDLCAKGDVGGGMLWLARGLEAAPSEAENLRQIARINLTSWLEERHTLRDLFPQEGAVHAVACSPDGKAILTGGVDKKARLWDTATGRLLLKPFDHPEPVRAVAFSPDGRRLATGCDDGLVRTWNAVTGEFCPPALRHPKAIRALAFSPDGRLLAVGGADGTARLWAVAGGNAAVGPMLHDGTVHAVAFSPDGKQLVTGSADRTAGFWSVETGKAVGDSLRFDGEVWTVAFSPDGYSVLTGTSDFDTHLWEAASHRSLRTVRHQSGVFSATFSPDGRKVLTGSRDGTARLWDVATGKPLGPPLRHPAAVRSVAWSPDGLTVVTGGEDGMTRRWEAGLSRPYPSVFRPPYPVESVAFSPDDKLVVAGGGVLGGKGGEARLWDVASGQPVGKPVRQSLLIHSVAFHPNGEAFLTGSEDGVVRLWRRDTQAPLGQPFVHSPKVYAAAFSPDGRLLLTGGGADFDKGEARFWDVATGKALDPPLPHAQRVLRVAFSRDGRLALTASEDSTARLWDTSSRRPLPLPTLQHQNAVWAGAFSPDGRTVLTGDWNTTAQLWETSTGKPFGPRFPHPASVLAGEFSPDGRTILTGCWDGNARLWDAASGKGLGPPLLHGGPVMSVAFSPANHTMLTGSRDGTARLWPIPAPMTGDVERLVLWCRLSTNLELDRDDVVRVLDGPTWQEYRKRLGEFGGPPDGSVPTPDCIRGWHRHEADEYERAGQWFAASWHLGRLIQAEPENKTYRDRRSQALAALSQPDPKKIIPARKPNPAEAKISLSRGAAYGRVGQWDQALVEFNNAVEFDPANARARHQRAHAYEHFRQWERALADFAKCIELQPADPSHWACRGKSHARTGHWTNALADASKAIELKPTDADYWDERGSIYFQSGQPDKANADFRRALQLQPDLAAAQNNLAWSLVAQPRVGAAEAAEAMALAKKAADREPDDADHWTTLGVARYRTGNWPASATALDKAAELAGDEHSGNLASGQAPLFLAMAHWKLGHKDEARRWYDRGVGWLEVHREALAPLKIRSEEFRRFRDEAAALLGVPPPSPGKDAAPPKGKPAAEPPGRPNP